MSRLILVTGPPGAGSTTLARATAAAIGDEGLAVALLEDDASARTRGARAIADGLDAVLVALGADAPPMEAWLGLPGLTALGILLRADELVDEVDAVVVDAGPLATARALIELPAALERMLDAALTPSLAMWRSTAGDDRAFSALTALREATRDLTLMLQDATTSVRVVVPPESSGVAAAQDAIALFAVLGVGVDGVIVNRFPRAKDDIRKRDRKRAHRALADLEQSPDGVEAWASTSKLRAAPKGRSPLGPMAEVHRLGDADIVVHATDDAFLLDLALPSAAAQQARIGVTADRLVVEYDGSYRWLDLPPVLRRCAPVSGLRGLGGIRFEFQPEPDVWMGGGAT